MTDGILLLGFGGPTPGCCGRRAVCPKTPGCEAECFVMGILGDNPARAPRAQEVAAHYHHLGGFSPYNDLTARQSAALEAELRRRGRDVRVAVGYRHWPPWIVDGLRALQGCDRVVLGVLAPHQSSVSWDWYLKAAAEAMDAIGPTAPPITAVAQPWHDHPGFIAATAARLREAVAGWSAERIAAAELVFTAHAIPQPVEATSPYRAQVVESARLAAEAFGHPRHRVAFQSQPSESRIPWSSPTVTAVIDETAAAGARDVILMAIGFLVDHVEVLYDLDHEAMAHARAKGVHPVRAACVHDHPAFIAMLADRIEAAL